VRRMRSGMLMLVACATVVGAVGGLLSLGSVAARSHGLARREERAAYGRLPLAFAANRGQAPGRYRYVAQGAGYALGLGRGGATLVLTRGRHARTALTMQTPGGRLLSPAPQRSLPGKVNYLIGTDRAEWIRDDPTYGRIVYRNVWPGVDLAFHGHQGILEYDVDLAPGADPSRVVLRFAGAQSVRTDGHGGAIIRVHGGELAIPAPLASQHGHPVASRLRVAGGELHLQLGGYDRAQPLVVDPDLVYSTYVGGSSIDEGSGIAVGSDGSAYITGQTSGAFPTTASAYQTTYGGGTFDAFVSKLNPAGSALSYTTYLGGSGDDYGYGIAVGSDGSAYVTGETAGGFPTSSSGEQTMYGGGYEDAFVSKLSPGGATLTYSTYLGGSGGDIGQAIAVGSDGSAYITGETTGSFPTTTGAYQTSFGGNTGGGNAFVSKLNPSGTTLSYSTYFGGLFDTGRAIAVGPDGSAYITGYTGGPLPTTPGAYQTASHGDFNYDAFVTKFNPAGSALSYSTYLGGGGDDYGFGIAVGSDGSAYVAGQTSGSFPTTAGAYQPTYGGGGTNAFVSKLNPAGSALSFSTYLGGSGGGDTANAIALGSDGSAYVTGVTEGSFPTTASAYQTSYGGGNYDAFVSKLNPAGSALSYSTYLGGSGNDLGSGVAVGSDGSAYITGDAGASFPVTLAAAQTTYGGGGADAFVSKLTIPGPSCQALHQTVAHNQAITLVLPCTDGNAPMTGFSVVSGPTHGTIDSPNQSTGAVRYAPDTGYAGVDSFTYQASSANGTTLVATAYLSVSEALAPACSDSSLNVSQGSSATLALACTTDRDPATLAVLAGPSHGTLGTLVGDTVTYTPAAGYTGPDTVTFRTTDTASSQSSPTATVYLTVVPEQQGLTGAPGATGPKGATGSAGKNGQLELVTCKTTTKTVHHRKQTRIICTTKLVSGTVKFKVASAADRATLTRGHLIYAAGPFRMANGARQLLLSPLRELVGGTYTLTMTRGRRTLGRVTVRLR
jgi:hypothetical protein